jgi:hypothetical protein
VRATAAGAAQRDRMAPKHFHRRLIAWQLETDLIIGHRQVKTLCVICLRRDNAANHGSFGGSAGPAADAVLLTQVSARMI